ncbi:MAG: DeoR/GlpR family DNA-binding transcription regulator [Oscillochloridaceae bacterium]|nr:DeoR/GlpR family DNA-binding transcription regulator [Chloroflexaceae bacterium]MDW8390836.1 DeoR/GlpR family DNA-binding transcription regulator [Oscillochloridaceae bacterium]
MEESLTAAPPRDDLEAPLMLDRRSRIAALVRQRGSVRVQELAELFQVSPVTIRSDLAHLEQEGLLVRDRGGAVAPATRSALIAFDQRATMNRAAKQRIGCVAASLVAPGDAILMDAGTTVVEMVPHLPRSGPLTVVTNALNVALELRSLPEARVILLGGTVNYATFGTLGPLAEQALEGMAVTRLFLAAETVDLAAGVTDSTIEIAQIKRAMVRAARQIVLLADSSKWGRTGFIKVAPLNAIHTVVTDAGLPEDARAALERLGVRVLIA